MFKKFFKKSKKEEIKEEASQVVVSEETVEEQAEKLQVEEEQQVEEVQKVEKPKEEVVKEVALDSSVEEIQNEELQLVEDKKEIEEVVEEPKMSLFERLKQGLSKAKQGITDRVDQVLKSYTKVDEDLLEEIEEILITADVGVDTTMNIIDKLTDAIKPVNKIS